VFDWVSILNQYVFFWAFCDFEVLFIWFGGGWEF